MRGSANIPFAEFFVVLRFSRFSVLGAAAIAVSGAVIGAQQPDVALSPFITFPSAGIPGPFTGLALTASAGPIALRGGAHISLHDRSGITATSASTMRPWGADADAIAFLQSLSYTDYLSFTPYMFAGIGTSAVDTAALRIMQRGWSYGAGLSLPLGNAIGVFGEWRARMSRLVLPTAYDAPDPTNELRVGMTFHIGSGGPSGRAVPNISAEETLFPDIAGIVSAVAARVLSTAETYLGTPYRRGGTSPSNGFDASGFVRFIFARFGVLLPRLSRDQARVGDRVRTDWHVIAPGDLLMFRDDGGINHVAIYAGGGRIIHSSESGGGVRYDDLESERGRWFLDHLVAARRVTPDVRGAILDLARGYTNDIGNNADGPDHAPRVSSRRRN
jgi:cell wall-associated NlpC family hydrolase